MSSVEGVLPMREGKMEMSLKLRSVLQLGWIQMTLVDAEAANRGTYKRRQGLYGNFLVVWNAEGTRNGCRKGPRSIFLDFGICLRVLGGSPLISDGPMLQDLCN